MQPKKLQSMFLCLSAFGLALHLLSSNLGAAPGDVFTWTNYGGGLNWGDASNWSPTPPNWNTAGADVDGVVADFQATPLPGSVIITNATATGGAQQPWLGTLKVGDRHSAYGIRFVKGANNGRLRFTNSVGPCIIDKVGVGDIVYSSQHIYTYNNNLIFQFGANAGKFVTTVGIQEQGGIPLVITLRGGGTLVCTNVNNQLSGGFIIQSNATLFFNGDAKLGNPGGNAPVSLWETNVVIGTGGRLICNGNNATPGTGNSTLNTNRGIRLQGTGEAIIGTANSSCGLIIPGPITSDGATTLRLIGPGRIQYDPGTTNTYDSDTILSGGLLSVRGELANNKALYCGSGTTLEFNFPLGSAVKAPISVDTLYTTNTVNVSILGINFKPGVLPLIKYNNLEGDGNDGLSLVGLPLGVLDGELTNDSVNKVIGFLVKDAVPFVSWRGATNDALGIPVRVTNWDIGVTSNWLSGLAEPAVYAEPGGIGYGALFDEATALTGRVEVVQVVKPTAVIVNNTNSSFEITGLAIDGAVKIAKQGPGTLTLSTANSFTGGITNSGGWIRFGDDNAAGTGPIVLNGLSTKLSSVGGNARTINNPLSINTATTLGDSTDNGLLTLKGLVDFRGNSRTITNPSPLVLDGGSTNGAVNKRGESTLTLKGIHDWSQSCDIENGTLIVAGILTNSAYVRVDCTDDNGLATLVISNGARMVLLGPTASARVGYSATNPNDVRTNVMVVHGEIRLPNASLPDGQLFVGRQGRGIAKAYLRAGADVEVSAVSHDGSAGSSLLYLDGGLLRAKQDNAAYMQGLESVTVESGGATIDTGAWTIGIGQPLQDGGGGLTKIGSGTLLLNGDNSYSGTTVVSQGTLGGNGSVAGNMTIHSGATLAPGSSIGTLTSGGTVTLGGDTLMEVGHTSADQLAATTSIQCGGSLTLTNNGILLGGEEFALFAGPLSGTFAQTNLALLGPGLSWNLDNLGINGQVKIDGALQAPGISGYRVAGTDLTLNGTNGWPNAQYWVVTSTNVTDVLATWLPVATNNFDGSGNFSVTLPMSLVEPQRFYSITLP